MTVSLAADTSSLEASPCLCWPSLRGKRMRRARYSFRRATFAARDSVERFWRRGSTEIPIVGASLRGIPASYVLSEPYKPDIPRIGYLQLLQGETTSSSYTSVVPDSWASDDRSQLVNWARCDGGSLCETGITASQLSARLLIVSFPFPCCFCMYILPGRSELELVAANPFGNLPPISMLFILNSAK